MFTVLFPCFILLMAAPKKKMKYSNKIHGVQSTTFCSLPIQNQLLTQSLFLGFHAWRLMYGLTYGNIPHRMLNIFLQFGKEWQLPSLVLKKHQVLKKTCLLNNHTFTPYWIQHNSSVLSNHSFISNSWPTVAPCKIFQNPPNTLTLKITTKMSARKLENVQHPTWCIPESWSHTLNSSPTASNVFILHHSLYTFVKWQARVCNKWLLLRINLIELQEIL